TIARRLVLRIPLYDAAKRLAGWVAQHIAVESRKFGLWTMKSLRKTALLVFLPLVSALAIAHAAQQRAADTPRQSEAQAKISVNSNLVILPVTVKDRSGNPVPDLHRDEFRVFQDNVDQN